MRFTRRAAALAAGIPLVLAGLTVTGIPAAQAAPEPATPVSQAVTWLTDQAVDGMLQGAYSDTFTDPGSPSWVTYDDQGLTIDAVESLAEVDADQGVIDEMTDAVEAQAEDYAGYGSGQVAKLIVLAQIAGRNAATFGGFSTPLPDQLEAKISTEAETEGQLDGALGSVTSQALAVRALDFTGSARAGDATGFLLRSQCSSGYFQTYFTAPDCVDGTSEPSVDTTATAVIELSDLDDSAVQSALTRARTWLAGAQKADGSWEGAAGSSANSTGLAVRALGSGPAATKGALWLRAHQARTAGTCTDKLTSVTGAIASNDAAWTDGLTDGVVPITTDGSSRALWIRATAQALPALAYLPAATGTLSATASAGYVRAGSAQTVSVRAAAPASAVCVTGGKASMLRYADSAGSASAQVTVPAGTATRALGLVDSSGRTTTLNLKVLDAAKLKVKPAKKKVKRNKKVKVTVKGLAPGEQVTVKVRKKKVSGTANAKGVFKVKVKVGKKLGKAKIAVTGEFGDRTGKAKVKVRK